MLFIFFSNKKFLPFFFYLFSFTLFHYSPFLSAQSLQADSIVIKKWENGYPREVKIFNKDSSFLVRKYFSEGQLQCEINYNSSAQLNGPEKCWFETGAKRSENYWRNGINIGSVILFYPSGQKSFEGKYLENGAPDGAWKGWYENGQIQYEQYYSSGLKTGKWINYKKDGGIGVVQYYELGNLVKEEKF